MYQTCKKRGEEKDSEVVKLILGRREREMREMDR